MSLRNSLLKCNVFRDEKIAEEQVVRILDFDIHLKKDYEGNRYIERITEIVPLEIEQGFSKDYRGIDGDKMEAFMDTIVQYFEKTTRQKSYDERVVLFYENGIYKIGSPMTQETVESMIQAMTEEDGKDFRTYLGSIWGSEYAYLYQCS